MAVGNVNWSDPSPGETARQYIDRMLGPPGSQQRKVGDPSAYQYYLRLWDTLRKERE